MSNEVRDRIAAIIRENRLPFDAADQILRGFAVLHRSEETIEGIGDGRLVCGSGPERCEVRRSENPNWLRNHAANAQALAEYLEGQAAKEAALTKRRDELANDVQSDILVIYRTNYEGIPAVTKRAIDRIIELEDQLGARP